MTRIPQLVLKERQAQASVSVYWTLGCDLDHNPMKRVAEVLRIQTRQVLESDASPDDRAAYFRFSGAVDRQGEHRFLGRAK
jgi:hypothetical protein